MAFDIPTTVNDAAARSADATSTDDGLDTIDVGDTSENVAPGAEDADQVDTTTDDSTDEGATDDGRSSHVKRANFDKVNNELRELREWRTAQESAQAAAPAVDPALAEWNTIREEFTRLGFGTPQQAAAAAAEQKRAADQAAREQEDQQIHAQVSSQLDYNDNPAAYEAYFQTLRNSMDLSKQAVWQAKTFAFQQFPDLDTAVVDAFATNPQQVEQIARHTHSRMAAVKAELTKAHAAELETAKKQAVLEYIESQKTNRAAAVERGTTGGVQRTAPAREPHKLGSGFRIPVMGPGRH